MTSSLFFHRRFLLWHFLHFVAVSAFRPPQSLQIFMYSLAFCAMVFLTGSNIGIKVTFFSGYFFDVYLKDIPFASNYPELLRLIYRPMASMISLGTSLGFWATSTPAALKASIFDCAVPVFPIIMAPACPMRLPVGAVRPAI